MSGEEDVRSVYIGYKTIEDERHREEPMRRLLLRGCLRRLRCRVIGPEHLEKMIGQVTRFREYASTIQQFERSKRYGD